jgi:hypothetical protein
MVATSFRCKLPEMAFDFCDPGVIISRAAALGCFMKSRYLPAIYGFLLVCAVAASADNPSPPHLSAQTRRDLIHAFDAELIYIRTQFPMGKKGLTLKDGKLSPDGQDLRQLLEMWGPSVKPGDLARISAIIIKHDSIRFEVNGGPIKKQKWYQHVSVSGGGGDVPLAPSDAEANPRGSYVDLIFDHYVPELKPQDLKTLLWPVFDFNSKSALESYLETLPPKVKDAIQNHQVLVGMNREMVIYSKGRAPKKIREKDGETEYEDWIYGDPPQAVDFVRLVGDEVVRVETMKVNGQKVIRTAKEVDLDRPTVAKGPEPSARPAAAPTLRRPGEDMPDMHTQGNPNGKQPMPLPGGAPSDPASDGPGSRDPNFVSSL